MPNTIYTFSQRYKGIVNAIYSEVYISDSYKTAIQPVEERRPEITCNGLWDTGATCTVITQKVVDALQLPVIAKTPIIGVGGTFTATMHVIDVWLPNRIVIPELKVTKGILGANFDILLGMDIITKGDFSISNLNGKTVFSYRVASLSSTGKDYMAKLEATKQINDKK